MADRTLRGSRLGAISYETEYGAEPAPRNVAAYRCARGHEFNVPFSEEAEIPTTWECRLDGTPAQLVDGPEPEAKKTKPPRTHWDMLMERRTIADLEEVLAERLDVLRARRGGGSKPACSVFARPPRAPRRGGVGPLTPRDSLTAHPGN